MANERNLDFAARLRVARHYRELSQKVVAAHLHLDRSTYAYYETGKSLPNLRTLRDLCTYMKVPVDFLLDMPPIPQNPELETILAEQYKK